MKKKNERNLVYISRLLVVIMFIIGFFMIMSDSFKVYTNLTYDISKNRSVKAIHLVSKYVAEETETKAVNTFGELLQYAKTNPVKFQGTMTGYGPDCIGCSGYLACPPRHNAKNGNIYFNDNTYGTIRIIAGDKSIPCGTIVKVEGLRKYDTFYAIVLDRGGAIKGTLFDLLYTSSSEAIKLGRANATYTIVRWGW